MMAFGNIYSAALVLWLSSTLPDCESIMVSFGTSKGPILPREKQQQPAETRLQPRNIVARSPAPVKEDREDRQDDTPNPNNYQPIGPHQYRDKILSLRPNPNLILGTAVDQKYTPSLQKYNIYRKQLARQDNSDYRGPVTFDNSIYFNNFQQKKTTLQPSVRYSKEELQRRGKAYYPNSYPNAKWVPQIGVIYSSGVRYYVPQIVYYDQTQQNNNVNSQANNRPHYENEENSVYDRDDQKYYHYDNRQ